MDKNEKGRWRTIIDEKVLIERLEGVKVGVNGLSDIVWNNAVKMCIREINDLASEHNNGWISIEDVLPGECEIVLFCTKYGYVRQGSRHIRYEHNTYDLAGVTHTFSDDEIVAWQPLPQTPKKGE